VKDNWKGEGLERGREGQKIHNRRILCNNGIANIRVAAMSVFTAKAGILYH